MQARASRAPSFDSGFCFSTWDGRLATGLCVDQRALMRSHALSSKEICPLVDLSGPTQFGSASRSSASSISACSSVAGKVRVVPACLCSAVKPEGLFAARRPLVGYCCFQASLASHMTASSPPSSTPSRYNFTGSVEVSPGHLEGSEDLTAVIPFPPEVQLLPIHVRISGVFLITDYVPVPLFGAPPLLALHVAPGTPHAVWLSVPPPPRDAGVDFSANLSLPVTGPGEYQVDVYVTGRHIHRQRLEVGIV